MPPKKDKGEKISADQGSALILEYLKQQNRPYSAIEISANLHNKVTKTYAAKALKELHDKKQIEGRAAGKQIVYHTLQDDDPEMLDNNHIAAMDQEIEELRDTVTALKAKEKSLKLEVNALALTMTTVDLERDLSALHKEEQEISARLEKSRKGKENEKVVTPEEVENVTKEWEIWKRHVTIRKNICKELWERCSEILPPNVETREELWESLGLEDSL